MGIFFHSFAACEFGYALIVAISTPISAEEFDRLSQESELRLEYLDGEVIELSTPRPIHNQIAKRLVALLDRHVISNSSGLVFWSDEFRLNERRRVIPDVAFMMAPKHQLVDLNRTPIDIIPDLTIEVISPSETALDVERKITAYLEAGVSEVWTVYPEAQHVYIHWSNTSKLLKAGDLVESALLPGWSCPVSEIFSIQVNIRD